MEALVWSWSEGGRNCRTNKVLTPTVFAWVPPTGTGKPMATTSSTTSTTMPLDG
jgi:hypothetical protein